MLQLLTAKEQARKERNARIKAGYERLKVTYPRATEARIFSALAAEHQLSSQSIRLICKSHE